MLGVTHVQLLPVNDYATVDEDHPDLLYNWGVTIQHNIMYQGSYITDPNDGYKRIQNVSVWYAVFISII